MSVVLRCPTCGTTRPTPGDCEACHEAQVRYFCTNHKPGLWVDSPTCPRCGGRFGEARRAPTLVPVPPVRTLPPAPARAPAPPPYSRVEPPHSRDEWAAREDLPAERAGGPAIGASPIAILLNLLGAAVRGRRAAPAPERGRRGGARSVLGCLVQMVLGFFTLLSALFLFGW
jgi:hypothetical protein